MPRVALLLLVASFGGALGVGARWSVHDGPHRGFAPVAGLADGRVCFVPARIVRRELRRRAGGRAADAGAESLGERAA